MKFETICKYGACLSIVWLMFSQNTSANTWYFSAMKGNDVNSGLSDAQSKKSISFLNTLSIQNGDSILLEKGSIWNQEPFLLKNITDVYIGTYGQGSLPVFQVRQLSQPAILVSQCQNVFLNSLVVKYADKEGILIDRSRGIVISNCTVDTSMRNGIAIYGGGDHISVMNCLVKYAKDNGIYFDGTPTQKISHCRVEYCTVLGTTTNDGIVIHDDMQSNTAGSGFQIRYNDVENCAEQGFDLTSGDSIYLEGNRSSRNHQGSLVVGWNVNNVIITRHESIDDGAQNGFAACIISGNANRIKICYSIFKGKMNRIFDIRGNVRNIEIYNNILDWGGTGSSMLDISEQTDSMFIFNNVFKLENESDSINGPLYIRNFTSHKPGWSGLFLNFNAYQKLQGRRFYMDGRLMLFASLRDSFQREMEGLYQIFTWDTGYVPFSNSQLINAGKIQGDLIDFYGRPIVGKPDIGAVEALSAGTPIDFSFPKTISWYPNPVSDQIYFAGENIYWELYSLKGKLMFSGNSNMANVSAVLPGMYIIKVNGSYAKIIISR